MRNGSVDAMEIDCYTKILNFFESHRYNRQKTDIWKSQSLITLMEKLTRTQDRRMVKNAIILLISLFDDHPPDILNNRGVHVNRLRGKDREIVISQLKDEFIPN